VIIANGSQLAGYVEVHDYAYISGLVAVHQYARIGKYAFVGGLSRVTQDIPPFFMAVGNPLGIVGVNLVGLKRHGFDGERIRIIQEAYKLLYRSGLNTSQAIERIKDLPMNEDIKELLSFIEDSERGITKKVLERKV
jgi:UDP-N-acetylglucosamine acyltransferase